MKRIQVEAGLIPRSYLDRMDWMYDLGNKLQQQKNNEEFITGIKKPNRKDVKHIFQEEATNRKCEEFVLLHEDPLYAIEKEEMKARETLMNNPIEMKTIIREVEEDYLRLHRKDSGNSHSTAKKSAKVSEPSRRTRRKDESHKRRKEQSRSRSPSSSSSSSSCSSSEADRSREKKSSTSKLYEDYMKSKFG
jgi:hypothetical protein